MALIDEWVDKAEADYQGASAMSRRRNHPLPDLVCFHCQQCAEKYLKAYLVLQGAQPPYTHDLVQLVNLCAPYDATLANLSPQAIVLNAYSVVVRYPGGASSVAEARDALSALRRLRRALRRRLGL